MRRRTFIAALGSAAAWPAVARAQQPAMPVIGFLNGQSPTTFDHLVAAFRGGLAETGFVEERNVKIEFRWADGKFERLPALAAELIQRPVNLLVAAGGAHAVAKAATASIPIVFTTPGEPVKEGLVTSLNRPGGNATGVSTFGTILEAKRLELLIELVPSELTIGMLFDPNLWTANLALPEVQAAAASLNKKLRVLTVNSDAELDATLASIDRTQFDVGGDPFFSSRRVQLVHLASRHAIPATYSQREFTDAGGLISYGPNLTDTFRQIGLHVGRILKGAKPADLPVEQSTKFELVINDETARMLGLTVPPQLLARADEVIE